MWNTKCYLCGSAAKYFVPPPDRLCEHIECPNCGQYEISLQAIMCKSYEKNSRVIVTGEVFSSFYYEHQIKLVKTEDFDNTRHVSTLEKLYNLARYIFTEQQKDGYTYLVQRPACCYENNGQGYVLLMRELKRLNIVDYVDTEDDDDDVTSWFTDVSMMPNAKIAFEDGITSIEHFRKVFITKSRSGGTFNLSSTIIGNQIEGDVIMGNKTEQNGIKGDNNTVGGSIDNENMAQRKNNLIVQIIVGVFIAVVAGVLLWFITPIGDKIKTEWQSHQSTKSPVEKSSDSEIPTVVNPAEVFPEAETKK